MTLRWTRRALADLARLYDFLAAEAQPAAERVVVSMSTAPERILRHPRIGVLVASLPAREIRRIFIGNYEMRYEIRGDELLILRFWNAREDR